MNGVRRFAPIGKTVVTRQKPSGLRSTTSLRSCTSSLIDDQSEIMHVLTADDPAEEAILRTPSHLNTVTSPEQDGVGIAGPQVGVAPKSRPIQVATGSCIQTVWGRSRVILG